MKKLSPRSDNEMFIVGLAFIAMFVIAMVV